MSKKGFYICGTGTDVGKTVVTSALLRCLKKNNIKSKVIKPIQTGCVDNKAIDLEYYKSLEVVQSYSSPLYCFEDPCSPHLALKIENREIDFERLKKYCETNIIDDGITLIESAGGITTPLNQDKIYLDLFSSFPLPIILVADNVLGMLNHTQLTIDRLNSLGLNIVAVVINHSNFSSDRLDKIIREDNILFLKEKYRNIEFLQLPYDKNLNKEEKIYFSSFDSKWESFSAKIIEILLKEITIEKDDIDKNHIWHPYTKAIRDSNFPIVESATGCLLKINGEFIIDGMSSWWCAIHGYNNEILNNAVRKQLSKMSHVMFGGLTHNSAKQLTQTLLNILPKGLEHIFYCDSGSVSVEVAIKMAIQYQIAQNKIKKTKILTVLGGYHGDTFGAMSVCDPDNGMHFKFKNVLIEQIFVNKPSCRFDSNYNSDSIVDIKSKIEKDKNEIAAVIIEPIVQGAGGMWIYHPIFLKELRKLCSENDVLLICDEIATGFGRTGELFACNHSNISPDIMCIGKALTGGYLSFAATISNRKIAEGISKDGGVLMHGPTFMANPLACSIAFENLKLLNSWDWKKKVKSIEKSLKSNLIELKKFDDVSDIRILGAIAVVELNREVDTEKCCLFFLEKKVWIRPFRNLIYIMPPFIISENQLKTLCLAIKEIIYKNKY